MAQLPNPIKVSANHNAIYEAYYKMVDPKNIGTIEAFDAAKFLKKSGLSDVVLSRIWDLSDPAGRGYLDKTGLFVALKLVSLAQAGHDVNMRNIFLETNAPRVGDLPKIKPQPAAVDWSIKPAERAKYENLFESRKPVNGLIPGNKVKDILMESKLPLETLGRIWDLADQDKDGSLDKHEFTVAMHLVYQALEKKAIPSSLPPQLQKPKTPPNSGGFADGGFIANFDNAPPPVVPPLPSSIPPMVPPMSRVAPVIPNLLDGLDDFMQTTPSPASSSSDWVVSPADKMRYDGIFARSDLDKDGLVSGMEVKDVFLRSGLEQRVLAHIWSLCDTDESGKLSIDQFALAMWFVEQKQKGNDPPSVLKPNMIPPSLRQGGVVPILAKIEPVEVKPTYSNPELEMIAKEIDELSREKRTLEVDVAQKEADIRIKTGEIRSLQSELDTLTATLKQLENQKGEAQKRLDDLKAQKNTLDLELNSFNVALNGVRKEVNKIREQCQKQEDTLKEQEGELDSKRSELQKLKDEENALNKQYDEGMNEMKALSKNLQDTQLEISQVRAMMSQLEECQRQMNDARSMFRMAIEADNPSIVSEYSLKLEPEFRDAKQLLEDKPKENPLVANTASDGFTTDTFNSNGFSTDPFSKSNGSAGFDDSFGHHGGFDNAFDQKPSDPFGAASSDPFNDSKGSGHDTSKDDFGCDPFANLHAPTANSVSHSLSPSKAGPPPRPESPSPALPPKKAKQPPPRPAPPRPLQAPKMPSSADAFGDSSGGSGFANFADFENKKVAADFFEDPFKDYRYEDPFDIKDPFADDTEKDEDPFSDANSIVSVNSTENFPFNSNTKFDDIFNNKTVDNNLNKTNDIDFFAPATLPKALSTTNNFNTLPTTKSDRTDFFDTFNDQFTKNSSSKNLANAFGDDKLTTNDENKNFTFDAFNDDFADDFSNLQIKTATGTSTTTTTKSTTTTSSKTGDMNFAQFDAFAAFETNNNNNNSFDPFGEPKKTVIPKIKVEKKDGVGKIATSTAAEDYSKGESFDADLDAVLKRSMIDQ